MFQKLKNTQKKIFNKIFAKDFLVGPLGLEPRMTESKSAVLPLHHGPKMNVCRTRHSYITLLGKLVGPLGLEPRMTESKSAVLPLHHGPLLP